MKRMILLFNHELTEEQENSARNDLLIKEFVYPDEKIKELWMGIDPKTESVISQLDMVVNWLRNVSTKGDYVLVQGEYGATCFIVDFCFSSGRVPVYATSKRVYKEFKLQNGSIERKHIFKHVRYRRFMRWKDFRQ